MAVSVRQLLGSVNPLFFTQALGNLNLRQYTGDGVITEFTVTDGLYENGVVVTENGILQMPGDDYTIAGSTLTFTTAPATGVQIQIREIAFSNIWTEVAVNTYQATRGQKLLVNTSAGAVTVMLPAFPVVGDEVTIVDASGTAATNNITVGRNANKILGQEQNLTISTDNSKTNLIYYSETVGWVVSAAGEGGGSGSATAIISETTPSTTTPGALWLDPTDLTLYIYYADNDSNQWVQINNK